MHPPSSVVGNETLIAYSPIDERHRHTGNTRQIVAGLLMGPAAGLAICRTRQGYYSLFGCDERWQSITDTFHDTLAEAMSQAEFEYEGVTRTWLTLTPAWLPLSEADGRAAWDLIDEQFRFRPSTKPQDWPSIAEPSPSVTFDVSHAFGDEQTFIRRTTELNLAILHALRHCTLPGQAVFALDWQHPSYRFNPYGDFDAASDDEWPITPCPDGDYQIFLAEDFSFGLFGHPWERTICIFGQRLLDAIAQQPAELLTRPIRRNAVTP